MSEAVTFWYGCNVLRHGDIIHACLDILRARRRPPGPIGHGEQRHAGNGNWDQQRKADQDSRTVG